MKQSNESNNVQPSDLSTEEVRESEALKKVKERVNSEEEVCQKPSYNRASLYTPAYND